MIPLQFDAWLDDFFAWYHRSHPVDATFIGIHDYDSVLPNWSQEGLERAADEMERLLARLHALPTGQLSLAQEMDARLAEGFLQIQRWEVNDNHFQRRNPDLHTGEAIFSVIGPFLRPYAPMSARVEAAVERMRAIPEFLARAQETVREAPSAWIDRARRDFIGAGLFFSEGIRELAAEEGIEDAAFLPAAEQAATAFAQFSAWLDDQPGGDDGYSCGREALELLLEHGHFVDETPESIGQLARSLMEEEAAYLEEHAGDFGASSPAEALAQLADLHPTVDEYYRRYEEMWDACRAQAEKKDLLTWPDFPISYVPQPRWARAAAPYLYFLFYRSPAPFDHVLPVQYLVTPVEPDMPAAEQQRRLRATNDSVIKLNHVVHHGATGHHVQNWHAFRAQSRIGQVAATDCASRIAMFCGGTMAEGWACYATELMAEAGFLTPLEEYAEHHSRLRMAARAAADVGLHTGSMTLAEIEEFYRQRVGMSPEAAHGEAVKNSMFPGTALMYLMGSHGIHRLRERLRQRSGFRLHEFHDRLLSFGSVPVALAASALEEAVHAG